jgi:hypothetical protein
MEQQTITFVVAGVGAVTTLSGIFLTHALTRSSERKKQRTNFVEQDIQTVLTSLYKLLSVYPAYATLRSPLYSNPPPDTLKEADGKYSTATVEFYRTINDRLYISREIVELRVKERWEKARNEYSKNIGNHNELKAEVDVIRDDLVAIMLERDMWWWNRWMHKRKRRKRLLL